MSKITNPTTESSVTCGFFNSINDRKYNAEQMSSIFNGLINDGVFASIGDTLVVSASSGNTVSVGTGKCWFDGTWTLNDAPLLIDCESSEALQTRIDAIVVEVDKNDNVRDNFIKFVKGTASQYNPVKPTLIKSERKKQYALCYITRAPGSSKITQSDIENVVGTDETPFVTGIVQVTSVDSLLGQWRQQLDDFIKAGEVKIDNFISSEETDFNIWYSDMRQMMSDVSAELNTWTSAEKTTIMNWFDNVKEQLTEDPALNLQIQIDALTVERLLVDGLPDGTKTISKDGTIIKSIDSKGRVLTKTFTNNFSTITSILKDRDDKEYLSYPYTVFSSGETITQNGITFIDNGDRSIKVNGTATSDINLVIETYSSTLPNDIYSLYGCPSNGSDETYHMYVEAYNDSERISIAKDYGNGTTFNISSLTYTSVNVVICIKSGTTVNNLVFKPHLKTSGSELGRLVKNVSSDGTVINITLTNNADAVPNLVEIERGLDTIIATENTYIGGSGS